MMAPAVSIFSDFLLGFNYAVLAYFGLITLSYMAVTMMSAVQARSYFRARSDLALRRSLQSQLTQPVAICIAAYNEASTIVNSISAVLTLNYPNFDVVLTNDGSTDDTLERLKQAFNLRKVDQPLRSDIPTARVRAIYRSRVHPNFTVVDKENGGRADGLNAAINASRSPLLCCIDADSILDRDALITAAQPFKERPDTTLGAGGIIRVANGCEVSGGHVTKIGLPRNHVAMFQVVEYLRAFLAARSGWSLVNGLLIISGAFGVFRRSAVADAGGFAADSIGEDFELCVRLHKMAHDQKRKYRLVFVPDPVCWTEVPEGFRELGGQRSRWHRGLTDTLWRHRRMIANPRYGTVGMMALPFFVLFELVGAFIEALGYVAIAVSLALGVVNVPFALLFLLIAVLSGVLLSLSAVLLEDVAFRRYARVRDLARLIWFALLENLGYRQLITIYRLRGFVGYLRGDKTWGEIKRLGFDEQMPVAERR